MHSFHVLVERDLATGLVMGSVIGWPGAHAQAATMDELEQNLREVVAMLLEDGDPKLASEFVQIQTLQVARTMGAPPLAKQAKIMAQSPQPRSERAFLEAGFFGLAVIVAFLGGVGILIALLLLGFGADPIPMLGVSAFVLTASAALWFYSRLAR